MIKKSQAITLAKNTTFNSDLIFTDIFVVVEPDSLVQFENDALVEFRGGVSFLGEDDATVDIISSDGTGAIMFHGNNQQTHLRNVTIRDFSLEKCVHCSFGKTSPITLYKTKFNIDTVLISNARAEDSLNIVSSEGTIQNLTIEDNAISDCLDVDFGVVKMDGIAVKHCGNDGLDFSFSKIFGHNISVSNVDDKLISIGETTGATLGHKNTLSFYRYSNKRWGNA